MKKYLNFIDGKWSESSSGKFTSIVNPANGQVLGEVTQSTEEDVIERYKPQRVLQKSWRLVPAPERAEFLYKVGYLLKERKEEIAQLLTSEMGKVIDEAREEVQEVIDMAFYMAGEGVYLAILFRLNYVINLL